MDFVKIAGILATAPELNCSLPYQSLVTYINLVRLLKHDIERWQPVEFDGPPVRLSTATHDFLKLSLGLDDEIAKRAWDSLRHVAWENGEEDVNQQVNSNLKYLNLFMKHGLCRGLGM